MILTDGWCGRGLHWLEDTSNSNGACRACINGSPQRVAVPPEVVGRFRAMYLDGSWRPYVTLALDDLIDGMARFIVRNRLDVLEAA